MDDTISVLLPVFNAEVFLEACLNSILQQTCPSFEVIAINDGSSDSSGAILSHFASLDSRIKAYHFKQNKGIVAALNYGLDKCSGKWVARMDADDLMHPERLALQWDYLKQHPAVDILGSRVTLFRFQGELTAGQKRYVDWSNGLLSQEEITANIFAESPLMHPTFFLKRDLYQRLGGYQDNPWAEDYDFILRAFLQNAEFAKLPQFLVDKGDHPGRVARTDDRCKRPAMFHAKAHYFVRKPDLWQGKRQTWIMGSGSAGKMALRALENQGYEISGFIDHTQSSGQRLVSNKPALTLERETASSFLEQHRDNLLLLCIGVEDGRRQVEALLQNSGFIQGKDYFRFI